MEVLSEVSGSEAACTAAEQSEIERALYEEIDRLETEFDWPQKSLGLSIDQQRALAGAWLGMAIRTQCEITDLHRRWRTPATSVAVGVQSRANSSSLGSTGIAKDLRVRESVSVIPTAFPTEDQDLPASWRHGQLRRRELALNGPVSRRLSARVPQHPPCRLTRISTDTHSCGAYRGLQHGPCRRFLLGCGWDPLLFRALTIN